MADIALPANIGDIVAGEVLAAEFLMLLADRDGSVLTHPAFFRATGKPGSNVVRVPHLGYGYDILAADTPGNQHTNTAFSDGHTDVTLANQVLMYGSHDLARYMADGKLDPMMFAQAGVIAIAQTLISLLANVGDGFTNVAGSSGVDASWEDVLAGKALLGVSKATGPICGLIHPQQWADLELDAMTLGIGPAAANPGIINAGLDAYKGNWFGVDWFVSSHVPASGGNRLGCMVTRGGLVWADAEFADDGDPNIINLGRGQFERVRKGDYSSSNYVIRAAMGVSLGIDAAGVTFRTDE